MSAFEDVPGQLSDGTSPTYVTGRLRRDDAAIESGEGRRLVGSLRHHFVVTYKDQEGMRQQLDERQIPGMVEDIDEAGWRAIAAALSNGGAYEVELHTTTTVTSVRRDRIDGEDGDDA